MNDFTEIISSTEITVKMPNHEYSNSYTDKVVSAFGRFALSCADMFEDRSTYPNATIHLEPTPVYMRSGVLTFAAVWGKATEFPLPRQRMVNEYFGSSLFGVKFKKKIQEVTTIDGYGFIGSISTGSESSISKLTTIMGSVNPGEYHLETYPMLNMTDADCSVMDTSANLITHRPLRFQQGVRWIPRNNYIGNTFGDDDEHRAQAILMSAI